MIHFLSLFFLFLVLVHLKMNKNNSLFQLCHHADHFVFAIALSYLSSTFAMHSGGSCLLSVGLCIDNTAA